MPKVARERMGGRLRGGAMETPNNGRSLLKQDLFEGIYTSTPLMKTTSNLTLAPFKTQGFSPIKEAFPQQSSLQNQITAQPELFKILSAQGQPKAAPPQPKPKIAPPQEKPKHPNLTKLGSKPELTKQNLTALNKKFLTSCVEILKKDNSTCIAPAMCDYLLQTMNIINQIQNTSAFPHLKDLLHDIRKLLTHMNGKYFEVKAKQDQIICECTGKQPKSFGKHNTHFPSLPTPPKSNHVSPTKCDNGKRERDPSPPRREPKVFSTFNGDYKFDKVIQGSETNKRLRDNDQPPSIPIPPFLCNGSAGISKKPDSNSFNYGSNSSVSPKMMNHPNSYENNFTPKINKMIEPGFFLPKPYKPISHSGPPITNDESPLVEKQKIEQSNTPWSIGGPLNGPKKFPTTSVFNPMPSFPSVESGSNTNKVFGSYSGPTTTTTVQTNGGGLSSIPNSVGSWGSFKAPPPPPTASNEGNSEDEDDEPPVEELKRVVETDALYSIKCKLFEKRNNAFADRGIGVLYINKLETEKYQVVIRADNSLGQLLLNLRLTPEIPVQKKGPNNVITFDPSADGGKGASILIRVKLSDDADELMKKLNEFKAF